MSRACLVRVERGRGRRGVSLVELLVVLSLIGILAGIAVPSYQKIVYKARAARIMGDLSAVRTAAYQYQAERGQWPPDAWTAVLPPSLEPYVSGVDFTGNGYELDWGNWGPYDGLHVLGISIFVEDPHLESALLSAFRDSGTTFARVNRRYTYFVN